MKAATLCLFFGLILQVCRGIEPASIGLPDALPPAPDGFKWVPVPELTDEFTGTKLDPAKWQPLLPYWKGRPPSQFAPENVIVKDGELQLLSTSLIDRLDQAKNPEKDIWVHAACVSSVKPIATYGYYEARVRASHLAMTSSFWLQGKYSEIDVIEQRGGYLLHTKDARYMFMNTHYFVESWKNDKSTPKKWEMPVSAAADFHVYGMWWKDSTTIWLYHNSKKVAEMKLGGAFMEPLYVIFDTEVFSNYGLPTIESLKAKEQNTMHVDWVRTWRLVKWQGALE